jgi:iron complex outermembrane receptor protein
MRYFAAQSARLAVLVTTTCLTAVNPGRAQTPTVSQNDSGPPQQNAAKPREALETITVVANKRKQNLQKVGIAVTALGSKQLRALGQTDITAIARQIPSVQFNQYSPTLTIFNIRGVSQNDFTDAQEAPIAYYSDGVYVSSLGAISGQMYDLDQVEVLRGPQGTLFGRNATGGLVEVNTAKPTASFAGYLQATGGSYGEYATEGAVSGPLFDWLKGRFAFQTDDHGGFVDNTNGPSLGTARAYSVRGQFDFDLGDAGDLLVKLYASRNDHEIPQGYKSLVSYPNDLGLGVFESPTTNYWGTCPGCNILGYRQATNNPFVVSDEKGMTPYFDRTYYGGTATYTKHFSDGMNLTSITDAQALHKAYDEDSSASPDGLLNYYTRQAMEQFSEELRLDGKTQNLNWITGLYLLSINSRNGYQALLPDLGASDVYSTKTQTYSAAGFAQGDYAVNDQLNIIVGARYSYDHKRFDYNILQNGSQSIAFNENTYPSLADKTFPNWSGKVEIDYKPSPDALLYGSINRGTKSGGFATPGSIPSTVSQLVNSVPFKQEELTNYEAGFKLTLLDQTTRLNGSIFHYDYHDYQAYSVVGLFQEITNNQAYVDGAELELTTRPIDNLTLNTFVSLLSTKIEDIIVPAGVALTRQMPQAPHYSIGASLTYGVDLAPGRLSFETDWKLNGSEYFSVFNAPVDKEEPDLVGNLRLSFNLKWNDHLEFDFFIKNVTNKYYRVYQLDESSLSFDQEVFAPPRWFGGSVRFTF